MNDSSDSAARPLNSLSSVAGSSVGGARATATVVVPPKPSAASKFESPAKLEPTGWRVTFSSLSNRNFFMLWLGMVFVMAGMQMQMLARGYLVYDITGSATLLGLVNAGTAIPMLGLSLFGGAFADRFERRRIIQVGQAVVAVLAVIIGFAVLTGYITWYYLMFASVLQGAMFAFMMPARQAIIPQLVGKEQLSNAMALNAAAMSAMTLAAPALGGGLYALAGPHNVYFLVSILAAAAVVITSFLPKTGNGAAKSSKSMTKDIAEGLVYISKNRLVLVLLAMGLATTMLAMPFRFLMPVFVVNVYHLGPENMGLLVSVMGGGSLVGALFIASIKEWHRGLLLIIGSFLSAIGLLLVSIFPFYFAAVLIMIPLGLGDAGRRTLNQSLIMEIVEDRFRGRVMSVFMLNFGLMPLAVLPTAIMVDIFGARVIIGMLAILLFVVTTLVLVTQKELRDKR